MFTNTNFFKVIQDSEILFAFKGNVNADLINGALIALETCLEEQEKDVQVKKKLISILVECIQNVLHHGADNRLSLIMVGSTEHSYTIQAGNVIVNKEVNELKEWLDAINSLSDDELRMAYKRILSEGELSNKGTAGLGFIEIARKSRHNIDYVFDWINDEKSIFSFCIKIPKTSVA
jgi:hypothetical protein